MTEMNFTSAEQSEKLSHAYMNREFCSTKERIGYIAKTCVSGMNIGQFDFGTDFFLYKLCNLSPNRVQQANIGLGIYDMINDPLSALIIDRMRTRWGKFKPFQYLAMIPSLIMGVITCILPLLIVNGGLGDTQTLWTYMAIAYINETIGAFFGGGGYIDKVFTPNPNERTSLLVTSKFISELGQKLPSQIAAIIMDLSVNGKINISIVKIYVIMKSTVFVLQKVPEIYWTLVSKERVCQSETPPPVLHSLLAVFRNKPLLMYTLSGVIDGINVGTSEALYYNDVLKFNTIGTVAGIPGSPISYVSYPLATKFRKRFSTKALWIMESGTVIFSESLLFLVGMIGGKENGFYLKKVPMTIAYALGNCIEMVFYATRKIIGDEINFEVLDYCEWKNGYRVEATINLITGYFNKVRDIILRVINARLLETWAGYQTGVEAVQTKDTMWRMFIAAFGPHLIFDIISIIPKFFYNIDSKTRDRMYLDLERRRSETAENLKKRTDMIDSQETSSPAE